MSLLIPVILAYPSFSPQGKNSSTREHNDTSVGLRVEPATWPLYSHIINMNKKKVTVSYGWILIKLRKEGDRCILGHQKDLEPNESSGGSDKIVVSPAKKLMEKL